MSQIEPHAPASRPRPQRRCVRCASGCTPRRTSGMAPMSPPACSRPDSSRRGPARPHASPRSRHAPTDRAPPATVAPPADHRASLVEHHGTDRHVTLLPGALSQRNRLAHRLVKFAHAPSLSKSRSQNLQIQNQNRHFPIHRLLYLRVLRARFMNNHQSGTMPMPYIEAYGRRSSTRYDTTSFRRDSRTIRRSGLGAVCLDVTRKRRSDADTAVVPRAAWMGIQ